MYIYLRVLCLFSLSPSSFPVKRSEGRSELVRFVTSPGSVVLTHFPVVGELTSIAKSFFFLSKMVAIVYIDRVVDDDDDDDNGIYS